MHIYKKLFIGILFVATFFFSAFVAVNDYFEVSKNLEIHADLYKELHQYYVDETNPGELMKTGIDAMLESLDPYTVYYPENTIEDARVAASGNYGGIGSSFRVIENQLMIAYPYENGPAAKVGLQSGDIIREVNGKDVSSLDIGSVLQLLKGAAGTKVSISVLRDNVLKNFQIERADIKVQAVPYSAYLNQNIGYIKLSRFSDDAFVQVKAALTNLKAQGKLQGLVFDLRGNPGGLLRDAIQICNLFIPKGKLVVSTKGKIPEWNKQYTTLENPVDESLPLAILIDRRSASASEIVAGVMQDYDRAVIIGNKSFGKGLVQTTRFLKYNTQLKVTVSKYYTPSGRCIQAIDYSKANKGNLQEQFQEFKTRVGRKVYDGGGVMPDIEMADEILSPISLALISQNLIFKYASLFKSKNSQEPNKDSFELSDSDYADFVSFVEKEGFTYMTDAEKSLTKTMKELAAEPTFAKLNDDLQSVEMKLKKEKMQALQVYKEQIKPLIAAEIMARYFYANGKLQWELNHDPELTEAIKILQDKNRYSHILSPAFSIPKMEKDTAGARFKTKYLEEIPEDIQD